MSNVAVALGASADVALWGTIGAAGIGLSNHWYLLCYFAAAVIIYGPLLLKLNKLPSRLA